GAPTCVRTRWIACARTSIAGSRIWSSTCQVRWTPLTSQPARRTSDSVGWLNATQGASQRQITGGVIVLEERLGRELIDGRPLYQYQVDQEHLSALEVLINHPRATEKQKIHALAPVAAARFASIYEDGVPSWAHCGAEIERLYGATQVS